MAEAKLAGAQLGLHGGIHHWTRSFDSMGLLIIYNRCLWAFNLWKISKKGRFTFDLA